MNEIQIPAVILAVKIAVKIAIVKITTIKLTIAEVKNVNLGIFKMEEVMKESEWLERATKFDLGTCMFYKRPVSIQARNQIDGSRKWVLKMHEWVLSKDGEFIFEPMPSNRTLEFIESTRFNSPDECHSCWVKLVTEAKPLFIG